MKIGILLDQITLGGPPKAAFEEVKYLRELGHDARLLVIMRRQTKGEYCYEDIIQDIPIEYLSDRLPQIFRRSFKLPYFSFFSSFHLTSALFTPRTIQKREYDILVSHGTYTCLTAHRLWRHKGIPYIAFIWDPISYILPRIYSSSSLRYGFPILRPLASRFDRLFVEDSLATITCSNAHVELLNKITSRKIEVVYPGCVPAVSLPRTRGDYILAVTKWDMGKRPSILLEVIQRIRGARLVVAGNWVQRSILDNFLKKIKRKELTKQVEVLGPTDQKTLRELYLGANVLIHPIFEAFGMTVLEAASHGCPFIIPKRSGVTDLFTHGIHGFFPTEGNIDEYANYVQVLISDKLLAWKMGHDAWEVTKKNTWKDHTIGLEKIITRYM